MTQVFCGGEQIATVNLTNPAKVGDEIEIRTDGELEVYEVKKVYTYFSEKGVANARMDVSPTGTSAFGILS